MKSILTLLFVTAVTPAISVYAQRTNQDSLKAIWQDESINDSLRMDAVVSLTWAKVYTQPDSALYYSEQLFAFAEKTGKPQHMARTFNLKGVCYERLGDYSKAIDYLTRSLKLWEEIGDMQGVAACWNNIGLIYESLGEFEKAIECFQKCLDISIEIQDTNRIALSMNTLGVMQKWEGRLDSALSFHRKGLNLARQSNNYYMSLLSLSNIGYDFYEMGLYDSAIYYLEEYSLRDSKMPEDNSYVLQFLAKTYHEIGNYEEALNLAEQSMEIAREGKQIGYIKGAAEILHRLYREGGRTTEALDMIELYVSMRDSLEKDGNKRELLRQEFEYQYEKQTLRDSLEYAQKEAIKNLELEKHKSDLSRQRFALAGAGSGLLLILTLAYVIYRGKRKSDELLLNILPSEIAEELKRNGKATARDFETVTILFTDFKEFTISAEKMKATELVAEIDACFKAFDRICEKHGVEKIKTIGDSYMAAGGLPVPDEDAVANTVTAGLEMAAFILNRKQMREREGKRSFEMRTGIHTGPVVAGIVGVKKFQYDVWGDTVNTASRMESHGAVGKVNISEATYELLKDKPGFIFEGRGKVEAKGKGKIDMYFVSRR